MKSFALLTLLLFGSLPQQASIKLEIGAKLDRKYIPRKNTQRIMTHPAQLRPFIERSVNGIKYVFAYDSKTRQIKYIHTTDQNFCTANGLRVGDEITLTSAQLEIIPYWEIRAPSTPDGWYPVVGHDLPFFDLKFEGNEARLVSISRFSKGSN